MPKSFYEIDPWGLHYKTLRTRNLWEMYIFRSKLVYYSFGKHIRLNKRTN
jgi:hypothetical protein